MRSTKAKQQYGFLHSVSESSTKYFAQYKADSSAPMSGTAGSHAPFKSPLAIQAALVSHIAFRIKTALPNVSTIKIR